MERSLSRSDEAAVSPSTEQRATPRSPGAITDRITVRLDVTISTMCAGFCLPRPCGTKFPFSGSAVLLAPCSSLAAWPSLPWRTGTLHLEHCGHDRCRIRASAYDVDTYGFRIAAARPRDIALDPRHTDPTGPRSSLRTWSWTWRHPTRPCTRHRRAKRPQEFQIVREYNSEIHEPLSK